MKRIGLRLAAMGIALVLAVGGYVLWLVWAAGQFKELEPGFAGACRRVEGLVGVEDITIDPRTGIAYLSSSDRRSALAGGLARGGLYAYDLRAADPRPVPLTPDADPAFHPHGISLWPGDGARPDRLFVINHPPGEHRIEIFERVGPQLVHRETLRDPLVVSPNDIAAVGPDRFFVTNDHGHGPESPWRVIEDYLRLPWANLVYYDGERFREAASGIVYANGVNASPDRSLVYVASPTTGSVLVYAHADGSLTLRERIEVGTGVDNIEIAGDGSLWIGAHPKLFDFVRHASDASFLAPSEVVRVRSLDAADPHRSSRSSPSQWAVEQIYLDLGEQLAGSSVAAVWGDRMLVGAVMDTAFLDCRLGSE